VISAGKIDSAASGHISVVIAEDTTLGGHNAPSATKVDPKTKKTVATGGMGAPLQTQAGVTNFKYGDDKPGHWWDAPNMKAGRRDHHRQGRQDQARARRQDPEAGRARALLDLRRRRAGHRDQARRAAAGRLDEDRRGRQARQAAKPPAP